MIEPTFAIQRPIILRPGFPSYDIESNQIKAYLGEYIVFQLEFAEGEFAELRIPFESGLDSGLITCTNSEEIDVQHD